MEQPRGEPDPGDLVSRLRAIRIDARRMTGGRCVLATMRLGEEPFPGLSRPTRIERVVFSSPGRDRIKCLRPRALFQLPILSIAGCADAADVEARIRAAWQQHLQTLRRARDRFSGLGLQASVTEQGAVLALPIAGESPSARVYAVRDSEAVLPSAGPLTGRALDGPESRSLAIPRNLESGVDVELHIASRLAELAAGGRRGRDTAPPASPDTAAWTSVGRREERRGRCILLVGPQLASGLPCIESLHLRGYEVATARGDGEALRCFAETSPELVLVDARLGRGEGLELIPALQRLAGVEHVPVVLVDDAPNATRRRAARSAGAAGYLVHPIDVPRIAESLARLMDAPPERRFTRYARRLSVRIDRDEQPCVATSLGRGGAFLVTDAALPTGSLHHCELSLPGPGRGLRVESEVRYRRGGGSARGRGIGVRFRGFPSDDEPRFIAFLESLKAPGPTGA